MIDIKQLNWEKTNGLIPAIIQDLTSGVILMLGYMNPAALLQTLDTNYITFYSRSKNRLWVKGETSGNKLKLVSIHTDCDQDTLLILATPTGPVCHLGHLSCFTKTPQTDWIFLQTLQNIIAERQKTLPDDSYIASLFKQGKQKITQKVGEEAIEVVLAAINESDAAFCGEVADLLFHLLVLLKARQVNLSEVIAVLKNRFEKKQLSTPN